MAPYIIIDMAPVSLLQIYTLATRLERTAVATKFLLIQTMFIIYHNSLELLARIRPSITAPNPTVLSVVLRIHNRPNP